MMIKRYLTSNGVKTAYQLIGLLACQLILFIVSDSYASSRESELFDQGYEYYLSYQPQKAVETFNIFLKEFPDSSAKDAAMFWLGKSLIRLKQFETAKKVFSEIKQKFPESPFISYIDRELEIISRAEAEVIISKTGTEETTLPEAKLSEIENKAKLSEENLSRTIEERDRLKSLLEEEKRKTEELKAQVTKLEEKEVELNILLSKFEEQQRDWEKFDEYLKQLKDEREQLESQIQKLNKEKTLAENEKEEIKERFNSEIRSLKDEILKIESEREELKGKLKKYEDAIIEVKGEAERELSKAMEAQKILETRIKGIENKVALTERELSKAKEDRDKLQVLLGEEKKKSKEMKVQLESQLQQLNKEKIQLEDEIREVKDKVRRYETISIVIKDKKHAPSEILESMIKSSVVMTKLGIKDVLWRNGNIYEDFVNEQILYDEAKRLNITEDAKRYKELIEKYNLKNEEADYLYRYLTISNLIDKRLKDMPEEKVVESLLVRFTEDDEYEKAVLATGLQRDAKSGESFENIYRSYPDVVRFTLRGSQEIHGWIKERVQPLQNGEVSDVIWTEDGYIILKPVLKRLSYRPFDPPEADVWPAAEGKIRVFIKEWMDELKKGIGDIKIERAE